MEQRHAWRTPEGGVRAPKDLIAPLEWREIERAEKSLKGQTRLPFRTARPADRRHHPGGRNFMGLLAVTYGGDLPVGIAAIKAMDNDCYLYNSFGQRTAIGHAGVRPAGGVENMGPGIVRGCLAVQPI